MTRPPLAFISLGSNRNSPAGGSADTLRAALRRLCPPGAKLVAVSRFYRTLAVPADSGPDFVNAAAALCFDGTPEVLMAHLHRVERAFGRKRQARWSARTLDLDLVAVGDRVLPDRDSHAHWRTLPVAAQARLAPDRLILPHPRIQDRGFVLIPLADIAPGWCHPVLKQSVTAMVAALPVTALAEIRPI